MAASGNFRHWRTASVFNPSTRMWAPVSSGYPYRKTQHPMRLSLITWNIDAFSSRAVARSKLILNHILEGPKLPDIIFLQEVTTAVRASLLDDARVRSAFLTTDAEDQKSFENVPFATMTLLSKARFAFVLDSQKEGNDIGEGEEKLMLGRVSRMTLPSKYRRDALCVDVIPDPTAPNVTFRLINVHLDSLGDTLHYRAQQLKILAGVLREPGCGGGIIAGDFNAISPDDAGLVDENGLVDAWVALHDGSANMDGATWSVGMERRDGLRPGRLDKVTIVSAKAEEIEILRPGLIEVPRPGETPVEIPWSDHCGLRCTFSI